MSNYKVTVPQTQIPPLPKRLTLWDLERGDYYTCERFGHELRKVLSKFKEGSAHDRIETANVPNSNNPLQNTVSEALNTTVIKWDIDIVASNPKFFKV